MLSGQYGLSEYVAQNLDLGHAVSIYKYRKVERISLLTWGRFIMVK
jgi:hypothetical protein